MNERIRKVAMANPDLNFYGLREISELLGVTQRTLLNYVTDGTLEAIKIGREWKVSEKSLRTFIDERKQASAKDHS